MDCIDTTSEEWTTSNLRRVDNQVGEQVREQEDKVNSCWLTPDREIVTYTKFDSCQKRYPHTEVLCLRICHYPKPQSRMIRWFAAFQKLYGCLSRCRISYQDS